MGQEGEMNLKEPIRLESFSDMSVYLSRDVIRC
jgi:hypothetical protein